MRAPSQFLPAVVFVTLSVNARAMACERLKPVSHAEFPAGQAVAMISGTSRHVTTPAHHIAIPQGPTESVHISLERTLCYGSCPSYSIELNGDGSASYDGQAFVLVKGKHAFTIAKADVACLLAQFGEADFWSLANDYSADITDGPTYRVTLTVGGETKTVTDYFGTEAGMPATVTALEDSIDRIGDAERWVKGKQNTLASLRAEEFDFHSSAAATMLAYAASAAPDDLIYNLIEAGTPLTGRSRGQDGPTAVENASYAGRTRVVQALIAKGAFAAAPPGTKESALRAAATSGNPLTVAEILKHGPDVNARDRDGNTALIEMWQSQRSIGRKAEADVLGVARLLIAAGADPNITNKTGMTALFSATGAEVVRLLIKAGAKVDVRNEYGSTPLLDAESDEAAVALIEAGADTTAKNRFGDTIEPEAKRREYARTLQLLQRAR